MYDKTVNIKLSLIPWSSKSGSVGPEQRKSNTYGLTCGDMESLHVPYDMPDTTYSTLQLPPYIDFIRIMIHGAWWLAQIECPSAVHIGMHTVCYNIMHTVGSTMGSVVWLTTMWLRV